VACSRVNFNFTISSLLDHPVCEGIPVLQPSRVYPCPSGRHNFKAVRRLDVWEHCLALCVQNVWFISAKKLAAFGYVMGVVLPRKFKLISRNLNWSAKRKYIPFVVRPITVRKGVGGVTLENEGRSAEWAI
jgi:hypothetical protein